MGLPAPAIKPLATHAGPQVVAPSTEAPAVRDAIPSLAPVAGPPRSKVGTFAAIGIAAAAVVGLAAFALLPKKGNLAIAVTGPGGAAVENVKVLLDGEPQCHTSACRLADVAAGAHVVRVIAEGYRQAADRPVRVESGRDENLEIALEKIDSVSKETGLDVPELGRHLRLSIDGKDLGALPARLTNLTPGEHTIRIAGSEQFAPFEDKLTLAAGQVLSYSPSLKITKGLARISAGSNAKGAKVELQCPSDSMHLKLPTTVEVAADQPCTLVATKRGMPEFRTTVAFSDGKAEKEFEVNFDLDKPSGDDPEPSAPSKPEPNRLAVRQAGAQHAPTTAPRSNAGAAAAPKSGQGRISINSTPMSGVLVDGRPAGRTPTSVAVSPGAHTVIFVHPERGRKMVSVHVQPGQTATAAARF